MTSEIVVVPGESAIDRAVAIIQEAHEKASEIPANVIRAGAILALQVGANPNPLAGELYIYPIQGRYTPYLGIAYYRRMAVERGAYVMFVPAGRDENGQRMSNEPRPMTADERALYNVPDNVDASICRGFRQDIFAQMLERGVPFEPAMEMCARVGVAFLRDEEKRDRSGKYMNPPNGRSWQWKCDKRAEVDLYRKLGVVAALVNQAEESAALTVQAERPRYTVEQANADLF